MRVFDEGVKEVMSLLLRLSKGHDREAEKVSDRSHGMAGFQMSFRDILPPFLVNCMDQLLQCRIHLLVGNI